MIKKLEEKGKMPKKWKSLESKQLFGNKIFGFREDKVQSPKTDKVHPVWVMDAPNWINIIPITAEKKVVLIKQYRFGNQEITLEIPGGMIDRGENPKEAAIRELKEETGFVAEKVIEIGRVNPNPALMSNFTYSFLALNAEKSFDQNLDGMEDIEVIEVNLEEVTELIREGKIDHALVVCAFYFFNQYKEASIDV